ncbi:hypothetical protein TNCV_388741 [Trichonephila clavipes]|nr:hypothetical protein TNCV_388741 [Trichonephila clavipes]
MENELQYSPDNPNNIGPTPVRITWLFGLAGVTAKSLFEPESASASAENSWLRGAGERDINKWMKEDGETAEFLTDDDIAASVTQEPIEEEGSDDETQCDKKDVVPHADGAAALALRYLEQQPETTPADVLFMRRWRNYASSKRLSSLRQKKITELM